LSHGHKTQAGRRNGTKGLSPHVPPRTTRAGRRLPRRPAVPGRTVLIGPSAPRRHVIRPVAGQMGTVPQSCPRGPGVPGRGKTVGQSPFVPWEQSGWNSRAARQDDTAMARGTGGDCSLVPRPQNARQTAKWDEGTVPTRPAPNKQAYTTPHPSPGCPSRTVPFLSPLLGPLGSVRGGTSEDSPAVLPAWP
jgi:hypothetical protein